MFGLWYFSLALEEIRKRFGFINRIFIFFTGNDISSNNPALTDTPTEEPCEPESDKTAQVDPKPTDKPVDDGPATKPSGVEDLPKPVEQPPKPVQVPTQPKVEAPLKPAPPKPAPVPETKPVEVPKPIVEPAKPKVEVPAPVPTPVAKPEPVIPKEQPKPVAPAPKIPEPATNGHQTKPAVPEPSAKPAAPTAEAARPLKPTSAEDGPLAASAAKSAAVELPASNEDSFIIVEQQKPKGPAAAAPTPASVRNSTVDFLRAEGGRSAPAPAQVAPPATRNKSDTMVDAAVLEKMEAGFAKLAASDSKSLLKKYLTKEVFDALKNKKTSFGSTLLDCVQSGFENPDSGVGIYAPDAEAYTVFADLFDPIIEDYHMGFKKTDKHPASDFGDVSTFGNVDPTGEFVVSTRVRCGRSMEGYPFNPCLTEAQYKEMEAKVSATLSGLEGELKGKFYPLTGMEKAVQQQLIDDHFLFKEGDRFLQAANACRYWPSGRGIYHNDNKTFLVWCNEEDHLRIISMQMGGDLGQVYRRLTSAVNEIEKRVPFSHNDRLGFLTFCPTNLGTTIRASVHIKVPKMAKDYANLEKVAGKYNLQVRGTRGEHSEAEGGIYDISNKRRMGLTEYEAVKEMYDGISELIKIEKSL
ncbi:arginine kinase 1 isoform X1 [Culex pipiens pallens]|uniref:arginine kinase 1 isoform X1 n=1 Tax=Culex pipiens pallens TaxID=42434 RepID=UPI0022AA9DC1|nr:arginine kinase 1 isoform X1 [Culex pipiens pallens]XP_052567198.1 arginine kinase 1 isoform X1 [Culex pipiens pallens]